MIRTPSVSTMPPTKLPTSNLDVFLSMAVSDFDVAVTEVRGILEVVIVILRCEDVADEVVVEVVVWLVLVV